MSEKYPDIIFGGGGGVIHWLEWCDSRNSTTKKIGCTTPIPPAITTQLCEYIYKKKSVFLNGFILFQRYSRFLRAISQQKIFH